jgi:hypothetical protein
MHVFVLMLYLGYGDERTLVIDDMYFKQVNYCNKVAESLVKRYSTHGIGLSDRAVAYCVPTRLEDPTKHSIY